MSELVLYNRELEQLRATVANLDTVDEAKDLADKAAGAEVWARRAKLGKDAVNHAGEVKIRAERRAGELLAVTVEHGGDRRSDSSSDRTNLKDLGITGDQSSQWQALAAVPEPEFDEAIEAEKTEGPLTSGGVLRRATPKPRRVTRSTRQTQVIKDAQQLVRLSERWTEDDCAALTPREASKQLTVLRKAVAFLQQQVVPVVEYRAATLSVRGRPSRFGSPQSKESAA